MPYENTVHGVVGTALEMICDSKLNDDLVIQNPNYKSMIGLARRVCRVIQSEVVTNYLGCCIEQTNRFIELNVSLVKRQANPYL